VVHLRLHKPQSRSLLVIACCISVLHWNSYSGSWLCQSHQEYLEDLSLFPMIISYVLDDSERSPTWNAQETTEHIFLLRLNSGSGNVTSIIPVLVVINLPTIVLQLVVLLSSVLMNGNGAEVYASRMMLLMVPVSASDLSRCSSLLTIRLTTHYQLSVWLLGEMIF
jgi:hypothetical protein